MKSKKNKFSMLPLLRHNPPHPTTWLLHIPDISRNHMTMVVHRRLPGRFTDIEYPDDSFFLILHPLPRIHPLILQNKLIPIRFRNKPEYVPGIDF